MAPLTATAVTAASTVPKAVTNANNLLHDAVLAVLLPWQKRPGPESTFQFAVHQEAENGICRILLLHKERDEAEPPFVLAHFEVRDGKVWLLQNETETDFGAALVEQGISRQQIVPGFLPPSVRKDSGYAVG